MNPQNPKENKYPETIFKSSYNYGEYLLNLFVNYRKVDNAFSFIIRKGKFMQIFNTTKDEKMSLLKNMISQLSNDERNELFSLFTPLKKE